MADYSNFIDKLKSSIDIEDFISEYLTLKRAGKNVKGLCPFHAEKSPSFTVFRDTQSFYCFGCQEAGDIIGFTMKIENLDFLEALEFLSAKSGTPLPKDNSYSEEGAALKRRILEANREAARFFFSQTQSYGVAQEYIAKRGLNPATIRHFGIGYAPESYHALTDHLKSKGFREEELIAAALSKRSEKGGVYDVFRSRLMFPIIDTRGSVIAFGGRLLEYVKNENGYTPPKYLNSSETLVFKKNRSLYSLQNAKKTGEKSVILCEGYMDVVSLWQAGFQNSVATLGTAIGEEQAMLISRSFSELVISYDADEAGQRAAERAEKICGGAGLALRILTMAGAKDPDEYIKSFGKAAFADCLKNAQSAESWRLGRAKGGADVSTPEGQAQFLQNSVRELCKIADPIKREVYLVRLAKENEISKTVLENAVAAELRKQRGIAGKVSKSELIKAATTAKAGISEEQRLGILDKKRAAAAEGIIYFLFAASDYAEYIFSNIEPELLPTEKYRNIFSALYQKLVASEKIEISSFTGVISGEEISLLAAVAARNRELPLTREVLDDLIAALKSEAAKTPKSFGEMSIEEIAEIAQKKLQNV